MTHTCLLDVWLGKLIAAEDREVGNVNRKVYLTWAKAAGGVYVGFAIIFYFYLGEAVSVAASWWLSYWSQHRNSGSAWFYLSIYACINVLVVCCSLWRELYARLRALTASRTLFLELVEAVLYAPMSFFDTTPLGRVINRFSNDTYTIDEQIPQTVRSYLNTIAKVTGVLMYISVVTPLFMLGLVPLFFFYLLAQRYYIATSRELTRIESISRSPIYALFAETLEGLATIHAYAIEATLAAKNNLLLDNNQRAYFLNYSANCWLAVRLELVGTLIVTSAALFAVLGRQAYLSGAASWDATSSAASSHATFAGLAGLSISLALSVTQSLNWTVRMASDMESQMVSVERVKSYSNMTQEAAHYLSSDPVNSSTALSPVHVSSSRTWPREGRIIFEEVCMRYRPGMPLVLQGLNLHIDPCEKVGIVGRTGAGRVHSNDAGTCRVNPTFCDVLCCDIGKSSLLTALLRLVELESGSIRIDGLDIKQLGLHALRSAMAVIPQDPVLFSGSVRSNLDPFQQYSDEELWEVLRRCLLTSAVTSLQDVVSENGANFSVGQRQLLCIARALLAKAKIIIMDEATAAVDVETDAIIQRTIRSEFAHATCLTVAHRLNTILDSDKVLVMDQGRAAEFATPADLLHDESSLFYALVANWEQNK
jgi:ATP-binding cassette subfamily C (CFTR/MRP) protein 1